MYEKYGVYKSGASTRKGTQVKTGGSYGAIKTILLFYKQVVPPELQLPSVQAPVGVACL